jgi:hypothetical protein
LARGNGTAGARTATAARARSSWVEAAKSSHAQRDLVEQPLVVREPVGDAEVRGDLAERLGVAAADRDDLRLG